MPTWPLSAGLRGDMVRRAEILAARRVEHAEADFPLTAEQMQRALLPDDVVERLRALRTEGIKTIARASEFGVCFECDALPGLKRGAVLLVNMQKPLFHKHEGSRYTIEWPKSAHDRADYTQLELDRIDNDVKAALALWIERAIRERRLQKMAHTTVARALDFMPTVAHLVVRWPALRLVVPPEETTARQRLANPPSRLGRYTWEHDPEANEWRQANLKQIAATEVVLTSAEMLDTFVRPDGAPHARVQAWEMLSGERV